MFLVFFQVRGLVQGCLGMLGGLVVHVALDVILGRLRAVGIMVMALKGISVRFVVGLSTIEQRPYSTILG